MSFPSLSSPLCLIWWCFVGVLFLLVLPGSVLSDEEDRGSTKARAAVGGDGWQNLDDDGFSPRVLVLDDSGAGAEPLPLLEVPSASLSPPRPLFLEATATSVAETTAVGPPDCQEWNADNRLECWLWQLAVEIPSQSFSADWISLSIHDMICTHFALHHLHSDYIVPHAVELSVRTLQATCKGKYHASGGISGKVEASVSTQSAGKKSSPVLEALQVAFRIVPTTTTAPLVPRPYTFQTTNCQTHLQATNIHFSGSISAKLIQAFSKTIGHYISQALQEQLCPLLPKQLDPLVTDYLHQFDDWMKPYLPKNQNGDGGSNGVLVADDYDYYSPNATNTIMTATISKSSMLSLVATTKRERTSRTTRERRLGSTTKLRQVEGKDIDTTTTIDHNSTGTAVNPVDWDIVRWALSFFNTELAEHLQQDWLFNSNTTQEYCPNNPKCQNLFRGFSGFFRSIVGPTLTVPLPEYFHNISLPPLPLDANISLGVISLSLQGLDLLNTLQVFRPTLAAAHAGNSNNKDVNAIPTALATRISTTKEIHISAPIALNIQMANSQHALTEPFTVKINVTQLETLLSTALQVVDWDQTTLLQVVNAIQRFVEDPTPANIQPMLGCLIRTIAKVENLGWITTVVLESISISRRTARVQNQSDDSSSLEDDLDHVINTLLELLLGEYSELWTDLMQGLIRDPARHSLNTYLMDWLKHHSSTDVCPPANNVLLPTTKASTTLAALTVAPPSAPKWLNFSKFLILDHFNDFLNQPPTLHTMNQYLECVGNYLEGYVAARQASSSSTGSDATRNVGAATGVAAAPKKQPPFHSMLEVVRVETKHWNAVQHVQLLQPTDDTTLESSIQWGSNTTVPQLHVTLQLDTKQLSGVVNLTLFAGLQAKLGTSLYYDLNRLENLTVAHLLQEAQCAMVPTVELRFLPHVTTANLGPLVGLNVSALLNNQSISYSTTTTTNGSDNSGTENKEKDKMAHMAADALEWSVEWIRNLVDKALEDWVERSPNMCPGIVPSDIKPDDNENDTGPAWYDFPMIWIVIVLVWVGQGGLLEIVNKAPQVAFGEESNHVAAEPDSLTTPLLSVPLDDEIMNPVPLEHDMDDYARDMREMEESLLNDIRDNSAISGGPSPPIIVEEETFVSDAAEEQELNKPLLTATAIPEMVRFAIPMLIITTIVLLFSSNVSVGASVDMSIRFGNTPIHLPGLFQFSLGNTISELFGAGIYPLLFLVVVFSGIWPYAKLLWMLFIWNASYRDTLKRENRLLTLDALSKFSLVDTYVLVIMLVAFRFHLDLSEELGLDVYVTPEYGFYAFLFATCMSLVLGHGMLYFHRKAENSGHHDAIITDVIERKSIFDHAFDVDNNGTRRTLSRFFQVIILASCLLAMVFLLLGFGQESFAFEFGGLAGMALGDNNKTSYSLVSLGAAIPRSVEDSSGLGILFLQIAYYFYAVLTPVACLTLLMALLLYPATSQIQKRLLVAAEIANAWSAVEVFVLSIVAALFQISTFASFIIGDKCDLVNQIAAQLTGGNIIPANDAVCFRVVASVESSCWYLVVGVLMNSFIVSLVLRIAHAAVHERTGHGGGNTLVRQLFGLPIIGAVFFGSSGTAAQEGNNNTAPDDGEAEGADEDAEDENAPEWRFWF